MEGGTESHINRKEVTFMIRNIIFDCFGTLIDTGSGSVEATGQYKPFPRFYEEILKSTYDINSGIKPDYIISSLNELENII